MTDTRGIASIVALPLVLLGLLAAWERRHSPK